MLGIGGVVGNCFVLYCLIWTKIIFHVRHAYVLNLALVDLLLATLALPTTAVSAFTRDWRFGAAFCHAAPVLQCVAVFVASYTLVLIAFDRYRAVTSADSMDTPAAYPIPVSIVLTWLISLCISSPYGAFMELDQAVTYFPIIDPLLDIPTYQNSSNNLAKLVYSRVHSELENKGYSIGRKTLCGVFCDEHWPLPPFGKTVFGSFVFFSQFLVPFALIAKFYHSVYESVRRRTISRLTSESTSIRTRQHLIRRRRRVNRLIAGMVGSFFISWLPLNLVNLLRDFGLMDAILPESAFAVFFVTCHIVGMTTVIWNPILYAFWNREFAREVVDKLSIIKAFILNSSVVTNESLPNNDMQNGKPAVKETEALQQQTFCIDDDNNSEVASL